MNSVEIKGLSKSFGDTEVFSNFSLSLGKGISIIKAPSGAGKTTLIRMIAGLEEVDAGEIYIQHSNVGYVFQQYNLFPNLSVKENILIEKSDLELFEELLNKLDIEELLEKYPFMLSGGQKQRVAIARALMQQPGLLCIDEPTSALDSKLTMSVANVINSLADYTDIIVITHDDTLVDYLNGEVIEL